MCRACEEGGRRCPGDTADARRARRYAAARKDAPGVKESVRGTPPTTPTAPAAPQHDLATPEGLRAHAEELRSARNQVADLMTDVMGGDGLPSADEVRALIADHPMGEYMTVTSGTFAIPVLDTVKYEAASTALGVKIDAWLDQELASEHQACMDAIIEMESEHALSDALGSKKEKADQAVAAYYARKRELMGQVRENGQTLVWTTGGVSTPARVDDAIQRSARFLPKDWIDASNRYADNEDPALPLPVRVRESSERSEYRSHGQVSRREQHTVFDFRDADDLDEVAHSPAHEVVTDEAAWTPAERAGATPGQVLVRKYDVARKKALLDSAPGAGALDDNGNFILKGARASGWEEHTYVDADGAQRTAWRKPSSFTLTTRTSVAEITIPVNKGGRGDEGEVSRVATHELIHRCEATTPALAGLERRFFERRTTDADGNQEPLQSYDPRVPDEGVRPDAFIDRYVGRDYKDMGGKFYEVMSVGSEAAFYGRHGAFGKIGLGRQDDDHHAFVLGAYATA